MISNEQIEGYLLETGREFSSPEENMWIIHSEEGENIVIYRSPPLVIFRVKVMDLPEDGHAQLFKTLLEYNATDMVVGAYGLAQEGIVIMETLQLENLDLNELQASIEGITMALAMHNKSLSAYQPSSLGKEQDAQLAAFDAQLISGA